MGNNELLTDLNNYISFS